MTEVKFYKDRVKGIRILVPSSVFVAMGVLLLVMVPGQTANPVLIWASVCLFALGIPIGLFQIFDRRPQIIMNVDQVWSRLSKHQAIKWEQMKMVYPIQVSGNWHIAVKTHKTFQSNVKHYKWFSDFLGTQKVNLNISQLKVDENQLAAFMLEMINTTRDNRPAVVEKYFGAKV